MPDYALVKGSPARHAGWMSRHGHVLHFDKNNQAVCPESGYGYALTQHAENAELRVRCLDLPEHVSLPHDKAIGRKSYRHYANL